MKESLNSRFESISPSAKSLLLTKALTNIPFGKEAAGLIWGVKSIESTKEKLSSLGFLMRLLHFEMRYLSIDKALLETRVKNIIELSSGFSFRGLSMCKDPGVFYIDTDLPEIIENKKAILLELTKSFCNYGIDNLFLQALNVLDRTAFTEIIDRFPTGPIAIVNEGLLVYFDEEQKQRLCKIIHDILMEKSGYWITADIYIKRETQDSTTNGFYIEKGKRFIAEHQVEENKFENFEAAEKFFKDCGFNIHKKIDIPSSQLSSRKLLANLPRGKLDELKSRKRNRETWILKFNH
jgi:O-methyltransferase involved in polyketide biosynthesis